MYLCMNTLPWFDDVERGGVALHCIAVSKERGRRAWAWAWAWGFV